MRSDPFRQRATFWIRHAFWAILTMIVIIPAGAQSASPLNIEMTLVSPSTISIGEPVVVHYKIINSGDKDIIVRLGEDRKQWFTTSVSDAQGNSLPSRMGIRPLQPWEQGAVSMIVASHSYQQGYVVPSALFSRSGGHTLLISVRLPYGTLEDDTLGTVTTGSAEKQFTEVYVAAFQFTLTVTPTAAGHLRGTAETLRKAILASHDDSQKDAEVQALCSLPEGEAWLSWQSLASDVHADPLTLVSLAKQLVKLHTNKAVDLLASLAWNPSQPLGPNADDNWLIAAYVSGDEQLKQHIRDVYAQFGVPFPDNPKPRRVID